MPIPVVGAYHGRDLERLAAATLAAQHLYVDRGLEFRDICEADAIGTRFGPVDRFLLEVKSGANVGVRDMFAFASHSRYLMVNHAAMLVPSQASIHMAEVARWGQIDLLRSDLSHDDVVRVLGRWLGGRPGGAQVDAFERGFYIEEKLQEAVRAVRATRPAAASAWENYLAIHRPSWARRGIAQRSGTAYDSFLLNPHAAETHARELDGTTWPTNSTALQDAVRLGNHPSVLGILLLEWANRLEVVRLMCEFAAAGLDPADPAPSVATLPAAFRTGVAAIRADPELQQRLPHILQAFIYCWGGVFLGLADLDAFAAELGTTAAFVQGALQTLDVLFPRGQGQSWLAQAFGASWLVLVPFPLQGNGALHRDAVRPGWPTSLAANLIAQLDSRRHAAAQLLAS